MTGAPNDLQTYNPDTMADWQFLRFRGCAITEMVSWAEEHSGPFTNFIRVDGETRVMFGFEDRGSAFAFAIHFNEDFLGWVE
jgi:hypothetical protein